MNHRAIGRRAGLTALAAMFPFAALPAQPGTWVPIQGNVRLADGTPICAMVLANGQYTFSCDGIGGYSLDVPLDENGQITLFSFAVGFAPFRVTAGPASFPYAVQMQAATSASPAPSIVGSWETNGGGILTFHSDGEYNIFSTLANCDVEGIEAGTYRYDEQNQRITSITVARDEDGDCGLADNYAPKLDFRIWRDQGVLRIVEAGYDEKVFPKIP